MPQQGAGISRALGPLFGAAFFVPGKCWTQGKITLKKFRKSAECRKCAIVF